MHHHREAAQTINNIAALTGLTGILVICIALLTSTYNSGSVANPKSVGNAVSVGCILIYLNLLLTPMVRLLRPRVNKWDWTASGFEWTAYALLPIAAKVWDNPNPEIARMGTWALGTSVVAMAVSGFSVWKARSVRNKECTTPPQHGNTP
jgi:hypothetical protein